jgi:hypothetical protein
MSELKELIKSLEIIYIFVITYLVIGFAYVMCDIQFPNCFFALTMFFGFKWLFNYRKCTISYIEVKLRGVKKEEGYLYRFLNYIVDFRYNPNVYLVYPFMIVFIIYHGMKTDGFKNVL